MVSDKCPGNAFRTLVNHLSKIWAFKLHLEIAFSNFDPSWNQTHLLIFQFCHDIYFQKTGYLSVVRLKIKIAHYYFGSEKTDIEYTRNVSFFAQYSRKYLFLKISSEVFTVSSGIGTTACCINQCLFCNKIKNCFQNIKYGNSPKHFEN